MVHEYIEILMNVDVYVSHGIRKKIRYGKNQNHREATQNIYDESIKREKFKRINDDSVFVTGEQWGPFKYKDYNEWKKEQDKEAYK